jgi:FMN phosphatase YigB (HAD superfamily)
MLTLTLTLTLTLALTLTLKDKPLMGIPHVAVSYLVSCFVLSCLGLVCIVVSCRVLSCRILSCLVLSCLFFSCLILPSLVLLCYLVLPCVVVSCYLVLSCLYLAFCLVLNKFHCSLACIIHSQEKMLHAGSNGSKRRVVMFDLGGVVADSPIVAIRKFSARRGLQDLNPFLGKSSAWAAFMRGEIGPSDFPETVYEESKLNDYSDGISLGASGWADMLSAMAGTGAGLMGEGDDDGLGGYRPLMIQTLRSLRAAGWTVAALTNNFDTPPLPDPKAQAIADAQHKKFVALFDHFIESRVVGLMKPDPLFYEHALNIIGCRFEALNILHYFRYCPYSAMSLELNQTQGR